jgi:hypothetical protein
MANETKKAGDEVEKILSMIQKLSPSDQRLLLEKFKPLSHRVVSVACNHATGVFQLSDSGMELYMRLSGNKDIYSLSRKDARDDLCLVYVIERYENHRKRGTSLDTTKISLALDQNFAIHNDDGYEIVYAQDVEPGQEWRKPSRDLPSNADEIFEKFLEDYPGGCNPYVDPNEVEEEDEWEEEEPEEEEMEFEEQQ